MMWWLVFCMLALPELVLAGYSEPGLRFRSHEADKEERTSLDITHRKKFRFKKYLCLEFDIRVIPDAEHYGHIMKVQVGDANQIELLLTNFPYPHLSYLMLYDKEIIDRKKPADETSFFEWTHFKIELVAQQDSLFSILENGTTVADRIALPDDRSVKIIFGADYGSRQVICDVAPFMIRNLAIRTTPGKVDCFWPLDALSEGPYVYDTRHDRPALLLNPRIDNHDRWKKVASLDFDSRAFFVKGAGNTGYFITRNGVQQYDFARNAMVARYAFLRICPSGSSKINSYTMRPATESCCMMSNSRIPSCGSISNIRSGRLPMIGETTIPICTITNCSLRWIRRCCSSSAMDCTVTGALSSGRIRPERSRVWISPLPYSPGI